MAPADNSPADRSPMLPTDVVQGVCPYARAFVQAALADTQAAAIVVTTACDQMRHAAGLLADISPRKHNGRCPVFLLNVPSTWRTAAAKRLYRDELKRFGRFLVELGGKSPSPAQLARVMLDHQRARSALRETRERLSGRQFAEAIAALRGQPTPPRDTGGAPPPSGGIPLAIVGGPLLEADYAILDLIEQAGGRLVLNATEGGERTLPADFDRQRIDDDPLRELADAYFTGIPDAFRRPNTELYEWLGREMAARDVRGVLLRRYVWCDIWHAELYKLKQWSPVPVLDTSAFYEDSALREDNAFHDGAGSLAHTAGRIETFMEILK
ncbi:MAG: hypothetical protein A2V70_02210 [Planctomycetes bacterium RBG_13_63_9]|nr:MAG: hypothetical protein A2V70_02210 [Planctomycetes bacterium RBG_13_63_9]